MRAYPMLIALFLASLIMIEKSQAGDSQLQNIYEFANPNLSIRPSYWSSDKELSATNHFAAGSAWLTLKPKEILGTQFFFDGYYLGEDLTRKTGHFWEAREAYLARSFGALDFRVGRQTLVWGRADKLNPTDYFSVHDYRRLMTDDDDQRLGLFTVLSTLNIGEYRISFVATPEWRTPDFPFDTHHNALQLVQIDPENSSRQFAIKLDHTAGTFDYSLSAFSGISKTPDISLISATASKIKVGANYHKITSMGGDFASTFGGFGIRGESAYTFTEDEKGTDPFVQNPFLYSVFGIEKSPLENLTVNLQYLNRWVNQWQDPSTSVAAPLVSLSKSQTISTHQDVRMNHGLSLRPNMKLWNETLEIETAWVAWFTTHEQLFRPKITYSVNDHIKTIVGAEFYEGAVDTFFGRLHENTTAFAELRIGF